MYIPGQAKYEPGTKCRASVLDKKLPTWERENGYAKKRIFGPKSKMEMPKSNIILDLSKKYAAKKMLLAVGLQPVSNFVVRLRSEFFRAHL